jgi:hypothetical protein
MVRQVASRRGARTGRAKRASRAGSARNRKTELRNVNHPGQVKHVDANMYAAMREAFLKVLPKTPPGLTEVAIRRKVVAHLPQDLFPDGAKAGWWTKAVQLDLEARGLVVRVKTTPLRWHKA